MLQCRNWGRGTKNAGEWEALTQGKGHTHKGHKGHTHKGRDTPTQGTHTHTHKGRAALTQGKGHTHTQGKGDAHTREGTNTQGGKTKLYVAPYLLQVTARFLLSELRG
jgi:hypothetical protein